MTERRIHGFGRQRPIAAHRLLVEVELLCVDDLPPRDLGGLLSRQATAGLHGMVRRVIRIELDGLEVPELAPEISAELVRQLRPRPDPRIGQAVIALNHAQDLLRQVLGWRELDADVEKVAPDPERDEAQP